MSSNKLIASVPHTGTHTMLSLFDLEYRHITPGTIDSFNNLDLYIPLRDPLASLCRVYSGCKAKELTHCSWDFASNHLESWRLLTTLEGSFYPFDLGNFHIMGSVGDYYLKDAYEAKDMEILRRVPGFEQLTEMEDLLRPVLMANGYRDLLWWN